MKVRSAITMKSTVLISTQKNQTDIFQFSINYSHSIIYKKINTKLNYLPIVLSTNLHNLKAY